MSKLHFLKSVTDTINTSFILESGDTLLMVDGGVPSETPYLYEYLKELGGHVTAWFITHFHDDHMGAFWTLLREHPDIRVDAVYWHLPSDEFIIRHAPKQDFWTSEEMLSGLRGVMAERGVKQVIVETGDVYSFDGGAVNVRILHTPDETLVHNPINDSSIVFRFEADGKRILVLGDLGPEGGDQLLAEVDHDELKSDFVQMAHHGQGCVKKDCYEVIHPTYCLWPTPTWLWENLGPRGYDTGIFGTVITRGWISSLRCVKKHYVMIKGTQVIDLTEV